MSAGVSAADCLQKKAPDSVCRTEPGTSDVPRAENIDRVCAPVDETAPGGFDAHSNHTPF